MAQAMIELGYREAGPAPAAPPAAVRERLRRRLTIALAALLCLTFVTASAPVGEPRGLRLLWSRKDAVPPSNTAIVGDMLVVIDGARSGQITGLDLHDGRVRWSRLLPGEAPWLTGVPAAGVVLVPAGLRFPEPDPQTGETSGPPFATETVALDVTTGAQRWRIPGDLLQATAADALLAEHDPTGSRIVALTVAGAADGVARWRKSTPELGQWALLGQDRQQHPDKIATVTDDEGRATVYRWGDGAEITHGRIAAWPGAQMGNGAAAKVSAVGDTVLITYSNDTSTEVTTYSTGRWAQGWSIKGGFSSGSTDCGPVVCMAHQGIMNGYDPVGGTPGWSVPGVDFAALSSAGLLSAHTVDGRMELLDPRDGRLVARLGPDLPISTAADDLVLLAGVASHGLAISRLDPADGSRYLLGAIPGSGSVAGADDYSCRLGGNLLVCTVGGTTSVTAVG
jgi:hypothetical protein